MTGEPRLPQRTLLAWNCDSDLPTRRARQLLRPALRSLGATEDLVEDGILMATEAVANATLHADGPYLLRLRHSPFEALVEVHDRTLHRPQLAPTETHLAHTTNDASTHGRGLLIIHQLSQGCWGFRTYPGHKVCWFAIPLGSNRPDNPSE